MMVLIFIYHIHSYAMGSVNIPSQSDLNKMYFHMQYQLSRLT
jgi:hypothetical protein